MRLYQQTCDLLAQEAAERGKRVTICCDEAQLYDAETLEGLRCLQNAGMDAQSPFGLILLAEPDVSSRRPPGPGPVVRPRGILLSADQENCCPPLRRTAVRL